MTLLTIAGSYSPLGTSTPDLAFCPVENIARHQHKLKFLGKRKLNIKQVRNHCEDVVAEWLWRQFRTTTWFSPTVGISRASSNLVHV